MASGEDQHKEIYEHAAEDSDVLSKRRRLMEDVAASQESSGQHETQELPGQLGTESQELPGQLVTESQELLGQLVTESQELPGQLVTESQELLGQLGTESQELPGQLVTESQELPAQLGTEPQELPGQLGTESHELPGQLGTESQELPGQLSTESQELPGQLGTESQELPGQLGTESQELPGQLVTEFQDLPGQLGTESQELPGQLVTESQELPGQLGTESQELPGQLGTVPQVNVGQDSSQQENQAGTIATSVSEVEGTVAAVQIRQSENPGTPVTALTASTNMRPSGASLTHEDRPHSMLNTVAAWRRENIYITKGVKAVKEKISSKGCVCVIGVPGAGKSTALHHAALSLQTDGFIIYCVYGPDEFLKYYDINKKQVFVLDDALGVYSVDQGKVKSWQEQNENVRLALGTYTKLLVSIRTQLFMYETIRDKNIVFLDKSVTTDHVDFNDTDYKLGIDDMRGMLRHYMTTDGVNDDNINKVIKQVWGYTDKELTEMTEDHRQYVMSEYSAGVEFSQCFPLLCRVYINTDFLKEDPREFFTNPFPALTKVFQNIKTDNKHQFCALALCTLFDGELTDDLVSPLSESPLCDDKNQLDKDKEIRNYIMSKYKLKCPDDLEDLQSALNSLTCVYILHVGDTYRVSHPVFHDIVTYLYNDPEFVFKYGRREFIRDRVRLNKDEQQHDPYVLVYSDNTNIERLADRLFRDLKSDPWRAADFIASDTNITDDRLISCLRSNLCDREITDKKLIDELFRQCMETVYDKKDTYEHGVVTQYKLIELCLQTGVDCNMYIGILPLHISVMTGSLQLTKLLLNYGADKRRVDSDGYSVLHLVCRDSKYNKSELIELLTQDGGDQSVVRFITSDSDEILSTVEPGRHGPRVRWAFEPVMDNLQLEEVLSDNSVKMLTTDKHDMKDYVEDCTGKIQLVERLHDNILTYVDSEGRNILHWSVDEYAVTQHLLTFQCVQHDIHKRDSKGGIACWYVVNDKKPYWSGDTEDVVIKDVVIENKQDMIDLYEKHGVI